MSIESLKIVSQGRVIGIPDWIDFAFGLGGYIHEYGIKCEKSTKILLSLPSEQFFSLFIVMGIVDKVFSKGEEFSSIREAVLRLEKGSRIIFKDEVSVRKVSVLSLEPSSVFVGQMLLYIKDGNMNRGVPECHWGERVILLDEEFDEIKRTRKISKKQHVGLDNSKLLSMLYKPEQLNKAEFYPGDSFYLVGNVADIHENINKEILSCGNVRGTIKDFLYFDNSNSYTNGKVFSSYAKKVEFEVDKQVPVIYSDLHSFLKHDRYFSKNPKIILSGRTDNENRLHEVKEDLKSMLLQEDCHLVTEELVNYFKYNEIQIPMGIEFLAWR